MNSSFLRSWWCVGLLCLCQAMAHAQVSTKPPARVAAARDDSPARQRWLAQSLSPTDPARFAWVRAAQALGRDADATDLRLALLDEWLQVLQGQPPGPASTAEVSLQRGRSVNPDDLQARARALWPPLLKKLWTPWDAQGLQVPIPAEIEALRAELSEEGPGLWVHRGKDGQPRGVYWQIALTNPTTQPLPMPEVQLYLGHTGQPPAPAWNCTLPRYAPHQVLLPRTAHTYLCRYSASGLQNPPAGTSWAQQMAQRQQQMVLLQTPTPANDQALTQTGQWLAQINNPAVDAFIQANQGCGPRGTCPAAKPQSKLAAEAPPPPQTWVEKHHALITRLQWAGGILAVLAAYVLVSIHISAFLASVLLWVGLAIPCGIFIRSLWTTSWADSWGGLVVIPATAAALVAPFLGTSMAYGVYRLFVSAEARRSALIGVGVVLFVIVMNLLEAWLF